MRNIFVLITITFLLSCNQKIQIPSYQIDGEIMGLKSGYVYLRCSDYKDTALVENGVFVFEGQVDRPRLCRISYEGSDSFREFYLENSRISFIGSIDSIGKAKITGSKNEEDRIAYDYLMSKFENEYAKLELKYQGADETLEAQLDKLYESIEMDQVAAQKQFIKQNPSSYQCVKIIYEIDWSFKNASELNVVLSTLDTLLQQSEDVKYLIGLSERMANVEIGVIAPDFEMKDTKGNSVRLSEMYPESVLLLLDFWASTCGPCRKENKIIREAFDMYHDKGFNVLGVSTDTKDQTWKKAIYDDGLIWTNVCNLKSWGENEVVSTYALRQVSQNFLIDNTGQIIGIDLRGDDLINMLEEFFN